MTTADGTFQTALFLAFLQCKETNCSCMVFGPRQQDAYARWVELNEAPKHWRLICDRPDLKVILWSDEELSEESLTTKKT